MKYLVLATLSLCLAMPALAKKSEKKEDKQTATLLVTEEGFEPSSLQVKSGISTILKVTRKTDHTCAKAISIPAKGKKVNLPLGKTVEIDLGKLDKGELRFVCGMDMMSGKILAD